MFKTSFIIIAASICNIISAAEGQDNLAEQGEKVIQNLCSKKSKTKAIKKLKNALSEENLSKTASFVAESDLSDAKKNALLEIIGQVQEECSKSP